MENASAIKDDISKSNFFKIFQINKEKCPIVYFGFNRKFPEGDNSIFFKINESKQVKPPRTLPAKKNKLGIEYSVIKRPITLRWEYWDGSSWKNLSVNDYTDDFHESGFIDFKCPEDFKNKIEFGKELFWLRLMFESGSFEIEPVILNILMNFSICI